jgi:hypothetical protein
MDGWEMDEMERGVRDVGDVGGDGWEMDGEGDGRQRWSTARVE